ncbi:MAG: hypothetical protein EPN79_16145 [Burkholderiaceae bacterium]|nr:MAG: hypothetical protein EPN79_16145 [Burkholderiaceae bacterium]
MSYDLDTGYITIVLKLPDDPTLRTAIAKTYRIDNDVGGARVTAVSIGDGISELERLETEHTER